MKKYKEEIIDGLIGCAKMYKVGIFEDLMIMDYVQSIWLQEGFDKIGDGFKVSVELSVGECSCGEKLITVPELLKLNDRVQEINDIIRNNVCAVPIDYKAAYVMVLGYDFGYNVAGAVTMMRDTPAIDYEIRLTVSPYAPEE